jgi:hypothetical protein
MLSLADLKKSTEEGYTYDIVLDFGSDRPPLTAIVVADTTFEALWPMVAKGGFYIAHNLQGTSSKRGSGGLLHEIIGWMEQMAHNKRELDKTWVKWQSPAPGSMRNVHCEQGACAMRKKFT